MLWPFLEICSPHLLQGSTSVLCYWLSAMHFGSIGASGKPCNLSNASAWIGEQVRPANQHRVSVLIRLFIAAVVHEVVDMQGGY